ncbi:ubiquitin carboxyl-terminal hydrolase 21-like isoform X2 [Phragmites australis]|uniref:ubiquitin carboxyl-terminal hydrolase 21-like isoform X2 n=1 Tax=Phragmites australis TaxID=29695 RepID=UPI002D7842A4|nr:ubiquitin carboxyl-terminal hydrolase 21-like isoform X2 [Phragmites australis]
MAEQDGAAGQSPPDSIPGIGAKNGEENCEQHQPYFSMCQPLRSVSYSNSWEGVCSPAANEHDHNSGLNSMVDEHMLIASCSPGNKQPQSESIYDPVGGESKSCSPSLIDKEAGLVQDGMDMEQSMQDDMGLRGVEANQQLLPLNSNQCNSNIGIEPCDMEDKQFPFSFSYRRKPQSVGAGLSNMGNTCFLNATLQCITHTVPLVLKLRSTDHSTPCSYNKDWFCSFCALKEHVDESIRRSGSVIMPAKFRDNLRKLSSDFRQGQQEDAHEFLRCLLDNLHKCTLDPRSKGKGSSFDEESMVKQVFGGQLKSQLSCCECGHSSESFEPFLDLSLEIDQVDHLVDALESFTKVEQIGDSEEKLTCESCNTQVCKNKQLTLDKAPDVIAFQLKRFTTLDNFIEKIDKHVVYPPELDLKPFHSNPDTAGELKYDLYGVVEHSGLPNYGHYVCTIRSSPITWHLMNDSHVDSINDASALNQEAYILFYVRQGKFPWFLSLLEGKDVQHDETTRGASPVSVLNTIDANCSTSSGEGNSNCSGDKSEKDETRHCKELEKDETSQYKSSFLPGEPSNRSPLGASNSNNIEDEINPCRVSLQDDASVRHLRTVETTNLDKPSTPCPKRLLSDNDLGLFDFEYFDDEETPLLPDLKLKPKVRKAMSASASKATKGPSVDQNATRLMRGMPASRRKGFLDCMLTQQNAKQESRRCPASDPLDKKKRKLVLQY